MPWSNTKFVLIGLVLFFLISSASSEEDIPATPLPRNSRTVTLAPLRQARLDSKKAAKAAQTAALANASLVASRLSWDENRVIGKITLQADGVEHIGQPVFIEAWNSDENRFIVVEQDTLTGNGYHDIELDGVYTQSLRVVVDPDAAATLSITSMSADEIILADSPRLMLIGDSITEGRGSSDGFGFRKILYDKLKTVSAAIDFVGSYGDAPYEGHFQGSRKIFDFYPPSLNNGGTGVMDVTSDMDVYRPTMVAIHLGTNGFTTNVDQMTTLIKYLLTWRSGKGKYLQQVVVSQIIPMKNKDSSVVVFNTKIANMVHSFQRGYVTGQAEPVYLCDHFTRFIEYPFVWATDSRTLMSDNLHPNGNGYQMMAATYADIMTPILTGTPNWFSSAEWGVGAAGLDHLYGGQGLALADINQDGKDEWYLSRIAPTSTQNRHLLYVTTDSMRWLERAEAMQAKDGGNSRGSLFFDMDNDGDLDLFNAHSPGQNRLLENVTNSYFRDITIQNGIEGNSEETSGVAALDVESDGDLDLFVLNVRATNELYINDGKGKFSRKDRGCNETYENNSDITRMSVAAADYDNDGDTDLYVVKRNSANRLYVNNGAGAFVDRAAYAGINLVHKCNGAFWADLDNDGDLDLIVTVSAIASEPEPVLRLYQNKGDGTFQNMTLTGAIPMAGYSVCVADFDKDGRQDIVTASEYTTGGYYKNEGNWQFRKISNTGAEVNAGDPRGAAALDMDNDGDMDFLLHRADAFTVLKKNNLVNSNHFLKVKAIGPKGNNSGIGTKVWLYQNNELGNAAALLGYREVLSANGHLTSPSPTLHFGLNTHTACDLLALFSDGTVLAMRNLTADQTVSIKPEIGQTGYGAPTAVLKQSGDQQSAQVGQPLADPIMVKVVDAQNRAVPNIKVDFTLSGGDAQLIQPTVTAGALWLDAELGRLCGRMRWTYDIAAGGSGFVMLAAQGSGSGSDTLALQTTQAGVYHGWMRAFNPNTTTATVRVQMDQQSKTSLAISELNGWQWLRLPGSGTTTGYMLTSGSHRFLLEWDQGALQVDRLLFTPDANYIPAGLGEQVNSDPLRTDQNGFTWRRVQLGGTAGAISIQARAGDYPALAPVLFQAQALAGKAAALTYVSGNNQPAGKKGTTLSAPFVVAVRDAFGNAIAGKLVQFKVAAGGGTLAPQDGRVLTGQNGQAAVVLTLGGSAGLQRVTAAADSVSGSPVTFEALVSGLATEMRMAAWTPPTDTVLNVLDTPVRITVLNDSGHPLPAYPVLFRAYQGGRVSSIKTAQGDSTLSLYTNAEGMVEAWWQLGSTSGEHSLIVDANGIKGSPALLKARAVPSAPALIFAAGGDQQSGVVGSRLKLPFQVRITDAHRNPVARQSVLFNVSGGDGSIDGVKQVTVLSDSSGLASAYLTLGTQAGAMTQSVRAGASFSSDRVSFYANALAGPAATLTNVSPLQQSAVIGTELSQPIQALVQDQYKNPVAGFTVEFRVSKGNGSFANSSTVMTAITDGQGMASATYHVGTAAGANSQQVTAMASGLTPGAMVFTITALANRPAMMTTATGSGQYGATYARLAEPFTITVSDSYGNPVAGHPVRFEVVSASGTLLGERSVEVLSDSSGTVRTYLTLAGERGDSAYVVEATSEFEGSPLTYSPTRFYASTLSATPARLFPITNPNQLLQGFAYHELEQPVQVQVIDESGRAVAGVRVEFSRSKGSGYFAPDNTPHLAVYTNSEGVATARFVLGAPGLDNGFTASASNGMVPLGNSPITYTALALAPEYKMELLSSPQPSAVVGTVIAESIRIRITDINDLAVANRSVRVQIVKGKGRFTANGDTVLVVTTAADGTAGAVWQLGVRAGLTTQQVLLSALDDSNNPIAGSPISIYAKALPDKPDGAQSSLTAVSPVFVGMNNGSPVTAVIKDKYGNVVPERQIKFSASGLAVSIDPSPLITDSLGTGKTMVRSTTAGIATLSCLDVVNNTKLGGSVSIQFNELSVASLSAVGNVERTAVAGDTLSEPLMVLVQDATGKGLTNSAVQFALVKGEANFLASGNVVDYRVSSDGTKVVDVLSDGAGLAQVKLLMGSKSGLVQVKASAKTNAGLNVQFSIQVHAAAASVLQKAGGDQQEGIAGHRLNQPLSVRLFDAFGNPVASHAIFFSSTAAGAGFLPASQVSTDSLGQAQVLWILGKETGLQQAAAAADGLAQTVLFVAQAGANSAPVLALQDSYHLSEGVLFRLTVPVYDAEMDTFALSVNPLPKGARLNGAVFQWQPGFDQAGDHAVEFVAEDSSGAISRKAVLLQVVNVNRPPQISAQNTIPAERNLDLKKPSGYIDFMVSATDADSDPLYYSWTVNGALRSTTSQLRFQSELYTAGLNTVKAVVSDGRDTSSVTWRIQITTAVLLSHYSGSYTPYVGAELLWSTRYEAENAGFYVWRSQNVGGPYERISPLLPAGSDGRYRYTDAGYTDHDGFYYRLQDVSRDGRLTDHEAIFVAVPLPTQFDLAQNYPNPFNSSTTMAFTVSQKEWVQLQIFDVTGRLVRTLLHETLKPGYYVRSWDGLDANERQVASGTYYGVLSTPAVRLSRKMVLLR